jgi:hypothetical protein
MRDLAILFLHLLATVARLAGPGGARAVVAESVLVKQQLAPAELPHEVVPGREGGPDLAEPLRQDGERAARHVSMTARASASCQ